MHRNRVSGGCLLAGALLLSGCASVKSHWPFGKQAKVGPPPVSELVLQVPDDGTVPAVLQFWERNTLVVDLQNVAGTGQVVLVRREGGRWPARMAVRMAPQRFETLEVRGAQRLVLPVSADDAGPVTADLPSGTHDETVGRITLSWGAKGAF